MAVIGAIDIGGTKIAVGVGLLCLPETGLFAVPGKSDLKPVKVVLRLSA